ncbi:MAG: hypothetical protein H6613_20300 [Ignavibacteriales bacterium]|nr:hypothetical protein [Ignavibacteriales bacterium]
MSKKIIQDEVYLNKFSRITYDSDVEVDTAYLAGKFQELIPKQIRIKLGLILLIETILMKVCYSMKLLK